MVMLAILILTGGDQARAREDGMLDLSTTQTHHEASLPLLDARIPGELATATFAMG